MAQKKAGKGIPVLLPPEAIPFFVRTFLLHRNMKKRSTADVLPFGYMAGEMRDQRCFAGFGVFMLRIESQFIKRSA